MAYSDDHPINWGILPGASLEAKLIPCPDSEKPVIVICGNRPGLVSLGIFLLQVSECGGDHESLSITGLPFVRLDSSLSLTVVSEFGDASRVVRMDRAEQFQWLTNDEDLKVVALGVIRVAFAPDGYLPNHCDAVDSSEETEAVLVIGRIENEDNTQQGNQR